MPHKQAHLGSVDKLIGQALADGLDVPEGSLARAGADEPDGLVDAAQRRHVDGLAADSARTADACRVLAGAAVHDGVNQHLQGVLFGVWVVVVVVVVR